MGSLAARAPQAAGFVWLLLSTTVFAQERNEELHWAVASVDDLCWEEADAKCAQLDHEGHRDWRLPTIEELTFERASIPRRLQDSLESSDVDTWACNASESKSTGGEGREIQRLRREELELERRLRVLEGHPDCPVSGLRRWLFSFSSGFPLRDNYNFAGGAALCVRGPKADCAETPKTRIPCFQAVSWSAPPASGVTIEGVAAGGSRAEVGRTRENGVLCVPREVLAAYRLLIGCVGDGCGAIDPQDPYGGVILVEPIQRGERSRPNRLCIAARSSSGYAIFGAPVRALDTSGAFRKLGTTSPSGRRCVVRKRLHDVETLLVCPNTACRAVPRRLFDSREELVLTFPPSYAWVPSQDIPGYHR